MEESCYYFYLCVSFTHVGVIFQELVLLSLWVPGIELRCQEVARAFTFDPVFLNRP